MDSTKGMISKEAIAMMKENVIVLNFARDTLVDEAAMVEALKAGKGKTVKITAAATDGSGRKATVSVKVY